MNVITVRIQFNVTFHVLNKNSQTCQRPISLHQSTFRFDLFAFWALRAMSFNSVCWVTPPPNVIGGQSGHILGRNPKWGSENATQLTGQNSELSVQYVFYAVIKSLCPFCLTIRFCSNLDHSEGWVCTLHWCGEIQIWRPVLEKWSIVFFQQSTRCETRTSHNIKKWGIAY